MNFLINWTFGSWIWIVECVVRQNFGKHPNLYPTAYHFYKWYNTHIWYDDFKQGVSHDLLFTLSFGHLPFCFAYPMVVTLLKFSNKRTIKVAKRCVVLLSRFPSIATMHPLWYYLWLVIGEGCQSRGSTLADDCHKNPQEGCER